VSKLVVLAVLVLAAVAAADTIRPGTEERTASERVGQAEEIFHPVASSGFVPAGEPVQNRVLYRGKEYLSPGDIADAFPASLPGAFFEIAHLAVAADGTLVLAVYGFPAGGEPVNAIQIWRDRTLESAFPVRPGTFGGGLGFAGNGRFIAGLSPDGLVVTLFTRQGRFAGRESATSW
jgi:hypothetical protein